MESVLTEFLRQYHLLGLTIGLLTFLVIGICHPLVIKGEYYFGTRCWWVFLIAGAVSLRGSCMGVRRALVVTARGLGIQHVLEHKRTFRTGRESKTGMVSRKSE